MICSSCGKEIKDGATFCSLCGAQLAVEEKVIEDDSSVAIAGNDEPKEPIATTPEPSNKPKSKKQKKWSLIVLIAVLTIVLIGGGIVTVITLQGVSARNRIDGIVAEYNEDLIDSEEAIAEIRAVNCYDRQDLLSYSAEALNTIDSLSVSKQAYADAVEYMQSESYENAIIALGLVSESDYNYQNAQEMLKEAQQKYLDSVLSLADLYISNNDFALAMDLCEKAKELVDSEELDTKIADAEEAKKEHIASLETEAQACMDNSDYDGAIDIYEYLYDLTGYESYKVDIESAEYLLVQSQSEELESQAQSALDSGDYLTAINTYEDLYDLTGESSYKDSLDAVSDTWSSQAIASAEEQLSQGNYDAAIACLSDAKAGIPDNSAIVAEEDRINSLRPVGIDKLLLFDSGYEAWTPKDNNTFTDNVGTTYNVPVYVDNPWGYDDSWWCYKLDGEYSTFTAQVVLPDYDYNCNSKVYLQVYADDELIYTSDAVTAQSLPQDVNLDISGATTIKLQVTGGSYYNSNSLGLVNPQVIPTYTPIG